MTVANLLKAPLVSTSGTVDNLTTGTTTSTAQIVTSGTFLGAITGSTNVINIGSGQIYKDASGNVGIGVTSPASPLHVRGSSVFGTVNVQSLSANAEASISFYDSADTNVDKWVIGKNVGGLSADQFCFYKNGNLAVIDTNGNVGIGDTAPSSKLDIVTASTTAYGLISRTPVVGLAAGSYVNMAYFSDSRGEQNDGLRIVNYRDSTGANSGNWETSSYRIRRSVDQSDASSGVQEEIVFGNSVLAFNTAGTERLRINSSGNVCVNRTSGDGKFNTDGAVYFYNFTAGVGNSTIKYNSGSGQLFYDTSSLRYKKNIRDSSYGLDSVTKMRSVQYEYKDSNYSDVGIIAEELEAIIPELVGKNADGQPESVLYDRLTSVLIKAVQELKTENDSLKSRIEALEAK
jgi:hypothetical protein